MAKKHFYQLIQHIRNFDYTSYFGVDFLLTINSKQIIIFTG